MSTKMANQLPKQIVEDGLLSIPLYHGTSTIWIESIKSKGLGGLDIVQFFRIKKAYEDLLRLGKSLVKDHDDLWIGHKLAAEQLLSNKASGFNFRHGHVYLSPCWHTAFNYAHSNHFGSEVASGFFECYEYLLGINRNAVKSVLSGYGDLLKLSERRGEPVIFGIDKVPVDNLDSENDVGLQKVIKNMEIKLEAVSSYGDPQRRLSLFLGLVQQCNFRLIYPIPFNQLKVFDECPDEP